MNDRRTKIIFDDGMEWKISQTRFSGYRKGIITQIGSVEGGNYKACTGVICKKFYRLVHFLQSYDIFPINLDKGEVWMDI